MSYFLFYLNLLECTKLLGYIMVTFINTASLLLIMASLHKAFRVYRNHSGNFQVYT